MNFAFAMIFFGSYMTAKGFDWLAQQRVAEEREALRLQREKYTRAMLDTRATHDPALPKACLTCGGVWSEECEHHGA